MPHFQKSEKISDDHATAGCGSRTARILFVRRTTPRPLGTLRTATYSVCTYYIPIFKVMQ